MIGIIMDMDSIRERLDQETIGKLANLSLYNDIDWSKEFPESYLFAVENSIRKIARFTNKSFDEVLEIACNSICSLNKIEESVCVYGYFPIEIPRCD